MTRQWGKSHSKQYSKKLLHFINGYIFSIHRIRCTTQGARRVYCFFSIFIYFCNRLLKKLLLIIAQRSTLNLHIRFVNDHAWVFIEDKILYTRVVFRPVIPFFLLNGSIFNQSYGFFCIWNLFIICYYRQNRSVCITAVNLLIWWGITMNSTSASSRTFFPNPGTFAQTVPLRFPLSWEVVAMLPLSQFSGMTRALVVASCFGI